MSLPSIELLEQRHAFPCHYTMKAIGSADENFTARVIFAVRDELRLDADPTFRIQTTKGGRHVSITIEPMFESAQQVLGLYSRLSQLDGLVMLL